MNRDQEDITDQLRNMHRALGAHLARCRTAAGVSQRRLGRALGYTSRTMVSKIEHGTRRMSASLWQIADELCRADGALVAEHATLAQAEQDSRSQPSPRHQTPAHSHAGTAPERSSDTADPRLGLAPVAGQLAEELMDTITRLVRSVGRRHAMQLVSWTLATLGLSGLDTEDYTRVAQAVANPSRVDAHVIKNLAITLTTCKRLQDKLGTGEVLNTVLAQHGIVRRLLDGGCPEQFSKPLRLLDANMACTIGFYLLDMGQPEAATRNFARARQSAHKAGNPAYAGYAAALTSLAAFLRGDTPAAVDSAAAARNLATRTGDLQLKAFAERTAADAYALDGQHSRCMAASERAHDFLTNLNGSSPDSPCYWVSHGQIDSTLSTALCLLGRPTQAVEVASTALGRFDCTYATSYAYLKVRLAHALALDKDITEAARVLGDVTSSAHLLPPRFTQQIHTVRGLLTPWAHTHAVKNLDSQLQVCGLGCPAVSGHTVCS